MTGLGGRHGRTIDPEALEELLRRDWLGRWESPVGAAIESMGIAHERFGPVHAFAVSRLADDPRLNAVLGASRPGAVSGGHLERALEWISTLRFVEPEYDDLMMRAEAVEGCRHSVPVTPDLPEADATEQLLAERGYERRGELVCMVRDGSPPRFPEPAGTDVDEIHEFAEGFDDLIAGAHGLPCNAAAFFAELPEAEDWRCYFAIDRRGVAAGCATMLVHDGVAKLGWAATRPDTRRQGLHLALVRRRVADAAAAGCRAIFAVLGAGEGAEAAGDFAAARRNLERAGFEAGPSMPVWESPEQGEQAGRTYPGA